MGPDTSELRLTEITSSVRGTLSGAYREWDITELEVLNRGQEFVVFKAESTRFGSVILKAPWQILINDGNDENVSAYAVLSQEATLTHALVTAGVPVPAAHGITADDIPFPFFVMEYLPHDGSPPEPVEFGRLMRLIHSLELPLQRTVGQIEDTLPNTLATLLIRRCALIERLAQVRIPMPSHEQITHGLATHESPRALLHMDARPANLLTRAGKIVGIIDWANSLVGDPALELCRIEEYGHLDAAFLNGYGTVEGLKNLPSDIDSFYRMHTTAMLAIVFLTAVPEPTQAQHYVARTVELAHRLSHHQTRRRP